MRPAFLIAIGSIALVAAVACTTSIPEQAAAPKAEAAPTAFIAASGPNGRIDYAPYTDSSSFTSAYRRLTESQYRHAIADTFGPAITINARFEPEKREDGLQAVGNAQLSITTSGLEQYLSVARSIADQVFAEKTRDAQLGCAETNAACAERFIKGRGRQLFRRPLSTAETASFMAIFNEASAQSNDFNKSLKLALVGMLMSPDFLFRVEKAERDPATLATFRLDGYAKAERVSYLLWDAAPDDELLEAARTGAIHDPAALKKQVDRLASSPRVADGIRAFFTDMLQFDAFDTLTKDSATYPKFSQAVADSAREETLRFLVDHLVTRKGDYRDIFTSQDTVINRALAAVYDVPYASSEKWSPYTFADSSERSGILTQASFLSLFSHPSASSPTIRGVKLHGIFLCIGTPDPPPDVDFSKVQALANGTVRTRLLDHMTNTGCASCHRISDPAGLSLEHFDGLGQRRDLENGAPIDVSADIDGTKFTGARGLGKYMHDQPEATSCLVRKVNAYGTGKPYDYKQASYLEAQTRAFAANGYRMIDLYKTILSDGRFFQVEPPKGVTPKSHVAAAPTPGSPGEGR